MTNTTTEPILKTTIRHRCGHTGQYVITKPRAVNWLRTQPCRACAAVEQQRQAATFERTHNLPPLIGTEKQIAFAAQIRCRIIHELLQLRRKIPNPVPPGPNQPRARAFLRLLEKTKRCTSARAWIDRKDFKATPEAINAILSKGVTA